MPSTKKPLPPQTRHKGWAAAGGALIANAAVWLLAAFARWLTGAEIAISLETYSAIFTIGTAASTAGGAWLGAFLQRNYEIDLSALGLQCSPAAVLAGLALAGVALGAAGCARAPDGSIDWAASTRQAAPRTTAGWDSGGLVGAIDGAAGAIVVICQTLDGEQVRVLVDTVAALAGREATVDNIRSVREGACLAAGLVDASLAAPAVAPMAPARP